MLDLLPKLNNYVKRMLNSSPAAKWSFLFEQGKYKYTIYLALGIFVYLPFRSKTRVKRKP
ncbi:hypothetical protein Lal_00017550 [Lupinus albus]|nr:hypothetical protein Lal_00017550 [Lupinus albus]